MKLTGYLNSGRLLVGTVVRGGLRARLFAQSLDPTRRGPAAWGLFLLWGAK